MPKKPITVSRPVLNSINKMLEYLEGEEAQNFLRWQEENPDADVEGHIYWHITKVSNWFEKVTKED